jgi:hypothetical protein
MQIFASFDPARSCDINDLSVEKFGHHAASNKLAARLHIQCEAKGSLCPEIVSAKQNLATGVSVHVAW